MVASCVSGWLPKNPRSHREETLDDRRRITVSVALIWIDVERESRCPNNGTPQRSFEGQFQQQDKSSETKIAAAAEMHLYRQEKPTVRLSDATRERALHYESSARTLMSTILGGEFAYGDSTRKPCQ